MRKKIIVRTFLAIWVFIWILFLGRSFYKENLAREYLTLLTLPAEGKQAYVLGDELRAFIKFCESSIAGPFTYNIIGLEGDSLDYRRARYYLYPNTDREEPDFLLVYKKIGFSKEGYKSFKTLDKDRYILRKIK